MKLRLVATTGLLALGAASLAAQGEPDWEVLLVDQNPDERLAPLVADWSAPFDIRAQSVQGRVDRRHWRRRARADRQ